MKPVVIDLSHWNVIPQSLKPARESGIVGVIHKATEGASYTDDKLIARWHLAQDAQMLWGGYHFVRPGDMVKQAAFFVAVMADCSDEHTLYALDWEDPAVSAEDALVFLESVEELTGRSPVLYSGHVCKQDPADALGNYRLWLAQYGTSCTLPSSHDQYWLWQYTDTGSVPGIDGDVDLNHYDGATNQLRAEWAGGDVIPAPDYDERVVRIIIDAPADVRVEVKVRGGV